MHHPDQRYIDALLNNDNDLLRELYEKCAEKISRMVSKNNGTDSDAGDLFQDALLMLFRKAKMGGFVLTCPIDAYLYMVCRNRWINELNRRGRSGVTFTDTEGYNLGEDSFRSAEVLIQQNERKNLIGEKLKELGDGCRRLLELAWSGINLEEVARKLNNSYGYTRKKKSECMAKLISLVKAAPSFSQLKW